MTINAWLLQAAKQLGVVGVGTARLDTLVLLEDITGRDRTWLLAHPEFELPASQAAKLEKLLSRREQHEPLAYIRGMTEFYGREFILTPAVLEPRPESEAMIELLKTLPVFGPSRPGLSLPSAKSGLTLRIADVGTGSGALGITAKLELPQTTVDLLEIDPAALQVAKTNVDKFTLNISVIKSNLLAGARQDYDILLCNLPYVPDDYQINQAASREPRLAIFGGSDGLDVYRKLFDQLTLLKKQPLYILTEALPPQHAVLAKLAAKCGYRLTAADDFIQVFERAG